EVVQRRAGHPQAALLLDRGRLGIALGDDDAPEVAAVFAGYVLPRRLPLVIAEADLAVRLHRIEEDAPAIVGHFQVVEVRPAIAIHADGGAEIHVVAAGAVRSHLAPPAEKSRLPALQRPLERLIGCEIDVVRYLLAVVDGHVTLLRPGSWKIRFAVTKLCAFPVELRLFAAPVHFQRARLADCVRSPENPVLPAREAAVDAGLHGFGRTEAQVRFHSGQGIRGEARALFQREPYLVVPIELVRRGGHQAQLQRPGRTE